MLRERGGWGVWVWGGRLGGSERVVVEGSMYVCVDRLSLVNVAMRGYLPTNQTPFIPL